ncbi:transcriptional regulator, TetR family [Catenulispora acidiphila DSM 44928]|uniref:Transcriptional regulator, TetR family n=1 Tax=Catenulispora acidiphila (strain DSM 44928 / JCM 14897 / NBRC 102108 / NRRL B-24433 / ID139908) TaxID=479433 RepID=C7Q0Z1_CATAD|nr:TetR/AcrR family transcriptional regulator [Catenulispora acidiphila]ACU71666.1 transcriptional regulator, TetR family [Catenulispora acidiphila DSM 44928]
MPPSPRRADAARNRQRLLTAADTVLNGHGAGASLDEIARVAGVGNATLYRHFPTRGRLIEAVYEQRITELCDKARELTVAPDPGTALTAWLRAVAAHVATSRLLREAFLADHPGPAGVEPPQAAAWHEALFDAAAPLLARAQDAEAVRPDIDIAELLMFLTAATQAAPQRADRALEVLMEGVLPRPVLPRPGAGTSG